MKTRSEARKAREREHESRSKTPEFSIDVPNDPINEQVVLAAMLVDDETRARIVKKFPPDVFYAEQHRAIMEGCGELVRRKLDFDPSTLVRLAPEIDIRTVETLMQARPDLPSNLEFHVDTLAWDWQRAQATKGPLAALLEAVQNPKETPERVKALAKQVAHVFEAENSQARYLRDSAEVVRQAMNAIRRRIEGEAFYPYGIKTLDYYEEGAVDTKGQDIGGTRRIRPGAAPGTIAMVTAVSGSGKSTFIGHLALNSARQKRKVLFGAWEEEAPVTIELLGALSLEWSRSKILDGRSNTLRDDNGDYEPLNHEELVRFEDTLHAISRYVTFFDNPFQRGKTRTGRRTTNEDHLDVIQDHLEFSGAEVFFADLWQRCLVDTSPDDERHALFRQLTIATEQRCHVVMAHQQRSKDIEMRADKRPTREGIIGSGAWLDVCWLVMAPHIPAKWKPVPDNTFELYILKQRNGPWPLCIEFDWDSDRGQIKNGRSIAVDSKGESSDDAFGKPSQLKGRRRR